MDSLKFSSFNLNKEVISSLTQCGFTTASQIQSKCLPPLLKGENILGLAPTGTGKTLAYLVPIINNLEPDKHLQAIIIVPTIALMDQIREVANDLLSNLSFPTNTLKVIKNKKDYNRSDPSIIITTLSQLKEVYSHYAVNNLKYLIIDEGDMITFDGFNQELSILKNPINKGIVSFFSASLNIQDITKIKRFFKIKNVVDVRSSLITAENVKHHFVNIRSVDKFQALKIMLKELNPYKAIIFCSSKKELYSLDSKLKKDGIDHLLISGDLDKREIKQALKNFADPKSHLLIGSDYASRGLDIPDVDCVISYDLPSKTEYYFHRAGRSGRFNREGDSYIIYSEDDNISVENIKTLLRRGVNGDLIILSKNGLKTSNGPYVFKNLGKKDQSNEKLQKQIRHAVMKTKSDKVKPGYKKKVKKAVEKVKLKHRMKIVRTNIAKSGGNAQDYHED